VRKRREIAVFSLSFLDILSGALGAVIILFVAVPKGAVKAPPDPMVDPEKALLREQLKALRTDLAQTKQELSVAAVKHLELTEAKAKLEAQPVPITSTGADQEADVGFKFKGKKLVFIIDTSYSMVEEDRMGQVKAGLKMLLTSLPPTYQVDIVQFPYGNRAPFRHLWGKLQDVTKNNRQEALQFIYGLRPNGSTPTRAVLEHALRTYHGASDFILLSDGAPSLYNSNKRDDVDEILQMVKAENHWGIQINTIGVGSDFIADQTTEEVRFLRELSNRHKGFFVGF
jgi:hypothetical protein